MIKKIIIFSAENKFLILSITTILIFASYLALKEIPIDAIPDMSDTQVIIYSKWDRSPDIIEDQVTYPIISSLLGAPKVKAIRGLSDFGYSFVYVIFQDGTDIYWARSRVLEYLNRIQNNLPSEVKTEIGPDATGVGWVYQYAIVDTKGILKSYELRALQDFKIKYLLNGISGVSEVAAIGGYKKQYQIEINPESMFSFKISMKDIISKLKDSNEESGARLLEFAGREYMIRGKGYVKSIEDLEQIGLGVDDRGNVIYLKNIAKISLGPDIRRGIGDFNGDGDSIGGIVVMRHGGNALNVISQVKEKIKEISQTLPDGVKIIPVYDRSELIQSTISNLKSKLIEEMLVVSTIILIFLWHFPSAIIPILTIPISVMISFIPLFLFGIDSNLMSLSGIAISIGVLVDGAIVEVENAYKKLEIWNSSGKKESYHKIRLDALLEVGPSVFFSLLIISVAFVPVFTLVDQEGRLFKPLAYSKNLTMAIAAILAITLDPAFRMLFSRIEPFRFKNKRINNSLNTVLIGKYYPEESHPISKRLFQIYEPICKYILEYPKRIVFSAVFLLLITIPVYWNLGTEFMPPLYEGSLLYMPTTLPGISVSEASKIMQIMDKKLVKIPEVKRVFGKSGRAETATDSAPFSMFETVIELKDRNEWRKRELNCKRDFSLLEIPCNTLTPIFKGLAYLIYPRIITKDDLIEILNHEVKFIGFSNAWTMPIKARIDMLSTGVRTPIGIKVLGYDLKEIERIGIQIESELKNIPKTTTAFSERISGGYFLDIQINREELARYGITIGDAQEIITTAIGGETLFETIEGRERYSVNIRYPRELRNTPEKLKHILVPTSDGNHIPLGELTSITFSEGPSMIRNENGLLAGYVYVDTSDSDIGGFVEKAKKRISENVKLPPAYNLIWSGQYENILRVKERMRIVIPFTIVIIFFLLYMNTRSYVKTFIILLAVPFSLIGAVGILYILNYQISIAVWVGMIALMGLDAETGSFMLLYLDLEYEKLIQKNPNPNLSELKIAILNGAVRRVRPKIMTVLCGIIGLLPILWSQGTGSDLMKRIAAPMVGGLTTSFILELLIYPAIFLIWKKKG